MTSPPRIYLLIRVVESPRNASLSSHYGDIKYFLFNLRHAFTKQCAAVWRSVPCKGRCACAARRVKNVDVKAYNP